VTAANRWLTADGTGVVNNIDGRSALSADLKRGDQAELRLNVTAPLTEGKYLLEIDMVNDGVSSFSRGGSTGLRWLVKVVRVGN
jgi:hypothetical protein